MSTLTDSKGRKTAATVFVEKATGNILIELKPVNEGVERLIMTPETALTMSQCLMQAATECVVVEAARFMLVAPEGALSNEQLDKLKQLVAAKAGAQ